MTQNPPHTIADVRCGRELIASSLGAGTSARASRSGSRCPAATASPSRIAASCAGRSTTTSRHPDPGDIALVVEIADSSLADDHQLAVEVYGPAGIPVCWIVNVNARRVEVYTRQGPQGYGPPEFFVEGQSVPVVIRGRVVGRIAVKDILPPRRRRPRAGGNGA